MNFSQKRSATLITALATGLVCSALAYAHGDTAGHKVIAPNDLTWNDIPAQPGAKRAVLFGDPTKPGPYTYRVKFPPNSKNPPHTHPDNRQVTIISGTWYFGHGDKLDTEKATKLPAGTFLTEPANSVHYTFTTSEEVTIQISGTGPTGSTPHK